MERYIFDEKNIPLILKGVNDYCTKINHKNLEEVRRLDNVIRGLEKKLRNIKNYIMDGRAEAFFMDDMEAITNDISRLKKERDSITVKEQVINITEDMLKRLIGKFAQKVIERSKEDCKVFIMDFVDSITVYEDKVVVVLKIADNALKMKRSVNRRFLPSKHTDKAE